MKKLKTTYKTGDKYYATDLNEANSTINEIEDALIGKIDKVSGGISGNLVALNNTGGLVDSGKKTGDFLTEHQQIKTVNNQSLIGTGNITISGSDFGDLIKTTDSKTHKKGIRIEGSNLNLVAHNENNVNKDVQYFNVKDEFIKLNDFRQNVETNELSKNVDFAFWQKNRVYIGQNVFFVDASKISWDTKGTTIRRINSIYEDDGEDKWCWMVQVCSVQKFATDKYKIINISHLDRDIDIYTYHRGGNFEYYDSLSKSLDTSELNEYFNDECQVFFTPFKQLFGDEVNLSDKFNTQMGYILRFNKKNCLWEFMPVYNKFEVYCKYHYLKVIKLPKGKYTRGTWRTYASPPELYETYTNGSYLDKYGMYAYLHVKHSRLSTGRSRYHSMKFTRMPYVHIDRASKEKSKVSISDILSSSKKRSRKIVGRQLKYLYVYVCDSIYNKRKNKRIQTSYGYVCKFRISNSHPTKITDEGIMKIAY